MLSIFKIYFFIFIILSTNQFYIKSSSVDHSYSDSSDDSSDDYIENNESTVGESISTLQNELKLSTSLPENVFEKEEDDQESNVCTLDNIMDNANYYLPDDYEENEKIGVKKRVKHINETFALIYRLNKYMNNITKKLEPLKKRIASRFMEAIYSMDVTNDCMTSIVNIVKGISEGQWWAIKFIDAWGGLPSGITEGTRTSFGEYDQCLGITSPSVISGPIIHGQYCLARVLTPYPSSDSLNLNKFYDTSLDSALIEAVESPLSDGVIPPMWRKLPKRMGQLFIDMFEFEKGATFRFGLCIPSTCSPKELEIEINKVVNPITRFPIEIESHCEIRNKAIELNRLQIAGIGLFSFLIVCTILSTSYEIYITKREKNCGEFLKPSTQSDFYLSFSIIRNTKTLFVDSPSLSCLDGIRLALMLWIIFVHTYVYLIINLPSISRTMNSVVFLMLTEKRYIFHRNLFIIDFFFFISGLLISYVMISKLEKSGGKFNYFQYVVFRYLRLVPSLIASIFFLWLFPLMLSGPIARETYELFLEGCERWYETVFLYHNYKAAYPKPALCNPPSWSLAADFHLYLIAPIIFLKMHSRPKLGVTYGIIGVIIGSLCCLAPKLLGIVSYYEWRSMESAIDLTLSARHHFYGTHAHITPFMLGMLLGYLLRHKPDLYLGGKIGETFCWIVCLSMSIGAMFWHGNWFLEPPNQTSLYLYLLFSKIFWCAGWAWIIFACATGRAKSLNHFLSASTFKPWTRLALGVCLFHTFPLMYRFSINRYLIDINDYSVFSGLMFDYLVSFLLAYISYILLENPVANLIQIFLMPKPKLPKQKSLEIKNGVTINLEQQVTRF